MLNVEQQRNAVMNAALQLPALVNKHMADDPQHRPFRALVKQMIPKMRETPASGRVQYHSAYKGGLLVHTNEVMHMAERLALMLDKTLVISAVKCAFLHDLGKLGDLSEPYYVFQDDDWRRDRLGENFTINTDLCYLPVPVRAVWIANQFGVMLTPSEVQAVLASDGPESAVGKMFGAVQEEPLTMIVHFADKWVSLAAEI